MKQIWLTGWSALLVVVLLIFPARVGQAQSEITIGSLLVELWPEFDRPEVLVIYRGQLSPNTPLPATVNFPLPPYVTQPHAVAVEENGQLLNVDPATINLEQAGDRNLLSFEVESPSFHFEYYDPQILTRQDQARQLDYSFTTVHPIDTLTLRLQEPSETQNFTMTPEPEESFLAQNGLTQHAVSQNDLAPGQAVGLSAAYTRPTGALTAQALGTPTEEPLDIAVISDSPINGNFNVAYLMLAAGLLLLLGTGGYWWWSRRSGVETAAAHRPARLRKRGSAPVKAKTNRPAARPEPGQPAPALPNAGYCYRCGTALRQDAEFCHACGARRRD